jgi:chromosome segregation ATPase
MSSEDFQNALDSLNRKLDTMSAFGKNQGDFRTNVANRISKIKTQVTQLSTLVDACIAKYQQLKNQHGDNSSELKQAKEDLEDAQKDLALCKGKIDALKAEKESLQNQLDDLTGENNNDKIKNLTEQLSDSNDKITELTQEKSQLTQELNKCKDDKNKLQQKNNDLENQIQQATAIINKAIAVLDSLNNIDPNEFDARFDEVKNIIEQITSRLNTGFGMSGPPAPRRSLRPQNRLRPGQQYQSSRLARNTNPGETNDESNTAYNRSIRDIPGGKRTKKGKRKGKKTRKGGKRKGSKK